MSWSDAALAPWTSFVMNALGLLFTIWSLFAAVGARRAAIEASRNVTTISSAIDINRQVERMAQLKSLIIDSNFVEIAKLSDDLRRQIVKLSASSLLDGDTKLELDNIKLFLGSVENSASKELPDFNIEVFNMNADKLIIISEKIRGVLDGK